MSLTFSLIGSGSLTRGFDALSNSCLSLLAICLGSDLKSDLGSLKDFFLEDLLCPNIKKIALKN